MEAKLRAAERAPSQVVRSAHRLCVAPMMTWTDRHCRALHRLLAPSARLYSEMASTDAVLHGDTARVLARGDDEHPVALQLGGRDPAHLAAAARLAEASGFDEVNLNVGCPSARVQRADIGACLMRAPGVVARGVRAMREAVRVPVTVKCRLGVAGTAGADRAAADYGFLRDFVGTVAEAGARVFIVHARIAVLAGLTPAQNRSIPPLRPDLVRRLKADFPELAVIVNGGILDTAAARAHLDWADGVMIGRGAYRNPRWLSALGRDLCGDATLDPWTAFDAYLPHVEAELRRGTRLHDMARHMLTLFNGLPGARRYRQHLSTHAGAADADIGTLQAAVRLVARADAATASRPAPQARAA